MFNGKEAGANESVAWDPVACFRLAALEAAFRFGRRASAVTLAAG
jgi:hypothetical protein